MNNRLFSLNKITISIGTVWLFHISAIIGSALGFTNWFIEKTPLNLLISLLLFVIVFPINTIKKGSILLLFFTVGMIVEWIGICYGYLFGDYVYGTNFGYKIDGVPILIGTYWALLPIMTKSITDYFRNQPKYGNILLATLLMVFLDFLMEQSAARFNFWEFSNNDPTFFNYICWAVIGLLFQTILHSTKITGNKQFCLHLYLAQCAFFFSFYCFL